MRRSYRIGWTAALVAAFGGCSYQAALDKMVSPERQKKLLAIGGLIFWLVRRRRAKRAA